MLRENLDKVHERIAQACQRSGRKFKDVTLVAVTKTIPKASILEAVSCGINQIGESRVQEALEKFPALQAGQPIEWHMIGHLQTNKAKGAVESFDWIQSIDSIRLIDAISRRAAATGTI